MSFFIVYFSVTVLFFFLLKRLGNQRTPAASAAASGVSPSLRISSVSSLSPAGGVAPARPQQQSSSTRLNIVCFLREITIVHSLLSRFEHQPP